MKVEVSQESLETWKLTFTLNSSRDIRNRAISRKFSIKLFTHSFKGLVSTINPFKIGQGGRLFDVFLHNSALVPATELSSRLPGDTPSGFVLTGYDSDLRFLGGSYEGSKFPRKFENILKK